MKIEERIAEIEKLNQIMKERDGGNTLFRLDKLFPIIKEQQEEIEKIKEELNGYKIVSTRRGKSVFISTLEQLNKGETK